ncbi:AGE family epimerase/isomerase [Galbibacter sp. EGI 63066]|uniref:AGE family epimerase/isomerase n=1 Tax=Galbibacter sp. EGI 63066 TaxID=2993559 RepID=UPI002248AF43|nr:AGE family epimerase/isomerase [Galbibacter sp. EGI 63066]MCX2678602.1 AGE family epimerase/isomerase [Galbibacter sp. EGI 63066]
MNSNALKIIKNELREELKSIISYWKTYSIDTENDGFIGRRDHYNHPIQQANKGIILNSRLLWSFSAILNSKEKDPDLKSYAERAFQYLHDHFRDKKYGGVYWELDHKGKPTIRKKQIYAQAFTVYALSEYYLFSEDKKAKAWAITIFELIEKHAFDTEKNGYIEAFEGDWKPIQDMRLSDKDLNGSKTMNTHLHILEAYTTLYKIHPEKAVKDALENLITLFLEKFLNKDYNFELFFDDDWNLQGELISFGHDIEAIWLLVDAAKSTKNDNLLQKVNAILVPVSDTFLKKGYIKAKGVLNEMDRATKKIDTDRHWWPQVEAMIGLYYSYEHSGNTVYKDALIDIWEFTKKHIIDRENGEWFFRIDENFKPYTNEDKTSMWKSPYHISRACLVLIDKLC